MFILLRFDSTHHTNHRYHINKKKNTDGSYVVMSDLDPCTIIDGVTQLIEELTVVTGNDTVSKEAQKNAICVFAILVRGELASKMVLKKHRLSSAAFDYVRRKDIMVFE